jgi:hypothetical protein
MDLIDRYLNAVSFWLPKDRKEDILKELAEDLLSEKEEKEAGLDRAMTGPEVEALLKTRGRPFQMAGRYLPSRHLIGPALFPMYVFALKLAVWIGFGVALVLPLALSFLLPGRSASLANVLARSFDSCWTLALTWFAMITIGFAVAESVQGRSGLGRDWNPSRLPAVRDGLKVKLSSSIAEILFGALFLFAWLGAFRVPVLILRGGEPIQLTASPLWLDLRGPYLVPIAMLTLTDIVMSAISLARPHLTRWRVAARAAVDAISAGLIGSLLLAHQEETRAALKGLKGLKDMAAGAAKLETLREWSLATALLAIAGAEAVSCVVGLVRLARWRTLESRAVARGQSSRAKP